MKLPRVRFTTRRMIVAVASMAAVCGGVVCCVRTVENRLVVENRFGQSLAWVRIGLANSGPIATFHELPDGGIETASFAIGGDDSFVLDTRLSDGTRVGGNFGYVTNGDYGVRPRFVVREGGKVDFTD
jgi:hypothetical protein